MKIWACRLNGNPDDGVRVKVHFRQKGNAVNFAFYNNQGYAHPVPSQAITRVSPSKQGVYRDPLNNRTNPWTLVERIYTYDPVGNWHGRDFKFKEYSVCRNDWNELTSITRNPS